ncbi:hypothetical protein F943_00668 [Acinetobacter ursingii NIPH 706]|nr:hypothetical protein F943_00668 [Acinetobacter ursingii NIPH 706]
MDHQKNASISLAFLRLNFSKIFKEYHLQTQV